jgi:hypothetical protein
MQDQFYLEDRVGLELLLQNINQYLTIFQNFLTYFILRIYLHLLFSSYAQQP